MLQHPILITFDWGRKMNSEALLQEHVVRYLRLCWKLGPDAETVNDEYRRIKDMLIVEIYFMKAVRRILTDDEMSGFVLYVEKDLRMMIDSFNPRRSTILAFLRHNMELRAMSYLAKNRRSRCFNTHFSNRLLTLGEETVQLGPEELVLRQQEELEKEERAGNVIDRLRHLCSIRPVKQRNLFIFLCTLLPCSSADMVDNFCSMLNIDKEQTFAIADYLAEMNSQVRMYRTSRGYLNMRRNYFLMRRIELELHIRSALNEQKLMEKLEYQKKQLKTVHREMEHTKMNVKYRILSEVLGITCSAIASAVFNAKKILEAASTDDDNFTYAADGDPELRRFEPFDVFNITMIPRPDAGEELFLATIGIA